ncbi:MAG: hypothetical protein NZ742_04760 [Acidobacteria bacterium]|nr:hypothetical protein [Acidobacteriota bacterium]MDW7984111.1 DUF6569 family protein [Acidobacteriota bacterium]
MLDGFQLETPQRADGVLTVFPLTVHYPPKRQSLTLGEALEQGRAKVLESGSVPEVVVDVRGDVAVLVLEGEVLTGGWQNRTVNISLLLEPGKAHRIPVSCVEQGRWSARRFRPLQPSRDPEVVAFEVAASHALPSKLRRSKTRSAVRMLQRRRVARSDQNEVWDAIECLLERTGTDAPTRDVTAYTALRLPLVEALLKSIEILPHQVGAVVALGDRVVAVEVLDHPETWRRLYKRILQSYALDALEAPETPPGVPSLEMARAFLGDVAQAFEEATVVPAPVGLGVHRLPREESAVQGFALVHEGTLYHLLAFRN